MARGYTMAQRHKLSFDPAAPSFSKENKSIFAVESHSLNIFFQEMRNNRDAFLFGSNTFLRTPDGGFKAGAGNPTSNICFANIASAILH